MSRFRQGKAEVGGDLAVERVRDVDHDAGAVTGVHFRAGGAAVIDVFQDVETVLDDRAAGSPLHVRHEADAAGVMLVCRVIQADWVQAQCWSPHSLPWSSIEL